MSREFSFLFFLSTWDIAGALVTTQSPLLEKEVFVVSSSSRPKNKKVAYVVRVLNV